MTATHSGRFVPDVRLSKVHRLLFTLFAAAVISALTPSSADAQCYLEGGSYSDGWFDEQDGTLYYMGSGADYSTCECGHVYQIYLTVTRVEDQVVTANLYDGNGNPLSDSSTEVTPGNYSIDVEFGIWCWCSSTYLPAAAQKVVTATAPSSCVPPTFGFGIFYHRYAIDNSPPFPALGSAINYAADRWNNFIWGFTSLKAYDHVNEINWDPLLHTVIVRIEGSMSGSSIWGTTDIVNRPMKININPDLFGNPSLYDAVMLHEMGHARGYDHVSNCLNQSILNDDFPWNGPYSTGFGQGDTIAAQRDIQ
jgi:hypothetical protein